MSEYYVNQITSTGGTTYDIAEGMTTRIFRGTCTTAGNTSPKIVALDDATGYSLTPGVRIAVTFTYGNDISTPALRVNSTSSADQKDVAIPTSRTDKTTGNGTTYNTWGPYETVFFTYDGTYWIINGSGRAIYNAYALAASKGNGTVTSVGITNGGGLSISNSPVTSSGTITIGHSNSTITAKTTQAVYPIKFDTYGHITGSGSAVTIPSKTSDLTNDSGFITDSDIPEGASAYTGTISAVSTTAASGSSNAFARGDHVHNITSSTITSALGYTPYDSTNPNGYISSYTDEKLKWTASTSSNTYYPLQSTSTATTGTANTLNSVSFYQYYNTAGGYRRLILGNTTAYTSTGGAYGTIRLYGTGATYYGDLNPGTIGANSLTGNRTWTLPNATGTIALTSDIPTIPTNVSSFTNDAGYITSADVPTVPTNVSAFTNDAGYITSYTDKKVAWTTYENQGSFYPLFATNPSNSDGGTISTSYASSLRFEQLISTTIANSPARLDLGTAYAATAANGLWGTIRLYGTGTYYGNLNPGDTTAANSLSATRTWTLPDATGTIALTSDIPTVPTITLNGSSTTSPSFYAPTTVGTSGYYLKSNGSGAPSWTAFPTIPSITLNGSSSTSPSFYAPIGAGTSGYYLKSNGSGAPSWTAFPTIPSITLNGSSTTSPSFYAPTTAGTSGYYLKSSGTGAPTWTAFPNIPTISQTLTSGVEIATVTVGSNTTKLYAPEGGSGSSTAVIVSEEYTFSFSFDAGTIGTRGYQGSTTISKTGYTPVSVVITYVGSSANYMPIPFLGGTNLNTLYCNIYRSTASAVSNSSVRVTVYYALDDGNAVSVNTYNGEVS